MTPDPTTPQYTTGWLADHLGGALDGSPEVSIVGMGSVDDAAGDQITFIADASHLGRWAQSGAAAAVISTSLAMPRDSRPTISVPDAEIASISLLRLFAPPPPRPDAGVHPTAWVHESASVAASAMIGPHVSVDRGAVVGAEVVLHAGVRIYVDSTIGEGSVLHSNCVIRERCRIGCRVVLHAGVVIGTDGFGYRPDPEGTGLLKVPHAGTVEIHDDVEIGAGSCVDRGKFGATVIGTGTKIDNVVQIAHNCRVGRHCLIASLTGLAGSVTIGDGVLVGGNVGIAEHVKIGDGVRIGAKSGLMRDVAAGSTVLGIPAEESREVLRQWSAVRKLPGLMRRLSREESPGR